MEAAPGSLPMRNFVATSHAEAAHNEDLSLEGGQNTERLSG